MSTYANNQTIGIFPAANANVERYTAVKLVAGEVTTAGDTQQAFGVCALDNPVSGQAVQVVVEGIAKVTSAAIIAADVLVTVDAAGKLKGTAAAGNFILGKLIKAVAVGEIGEVYLTKNTKA